MPVKATRSEKVIKSAVAGEDWRAIVRAYWAAAGAGAHAVAVVDNLRCVRNMTTVKTKIEFIASALKNLYMCADTQIYVLLLAGVARQPISLDQFAADMLNVLVAYRRVPCCRARLNCLETRLHR